MITDQSPSESSSEPLVGEIQFFSPSSRINRLRYWAHSMLMAIPFYIVLGLSCFLASKVSPIFWGLAAIAYIGMIVFGFILMIQRLHDLNKSGWLSLLMLIPLANIFVAILLIFFEGTRGPNDYGLPTPPNKTWHWVLALMMPVVMVVGILAAVALPAYQQYVQRAHQAQAASSVAPDAAEVSSSEESTEAPEESAMPSEEGEEPGGESSTAATDSTETSSVSESSEPAKAQ